MNTLRGEYCVMKEDCEQYFYEILERLFENWGGLKILHLCAHIYYNHVRDVIQSEGG